MVSSNESNGMVMPVAPAYGGGGGFGNTFGGDWAWILLLLLLCGNGWGNGFGGFGGGDMYPWMNQQNQINDGFRDQMLNGSISGIQQSVTTGFGDVQNALCGVNAAMSNGFAQAEISENARQMANMNQMFGIQSSLQNCCCENRAGIADLKYAVATEACADRNAISSALRDVLEANNASTQKILDQMCADKIDAKNERIAELQNQLTMANLAASQNLQTQQILAGQDRGVNAIEQYLAPTPRPAYIVQNPNCCPQNFACGCAA